MSRRTTWILIGLIVLVSLPLLAYAWVYVAFSGGMTSIILNHRAGPDLNDPALATARKKVEANIDLALKDIESKAPFTLYATSKHDRCYRGDNNWKHQEGFASRCQVRVARFYGLDGDLRERITALEDALLNDKWTSYEYTTWQSVGGSELKQVVDNVRNPPLYKKYDVFVDVQFIDQRQSAVSDLEHFQSAYSRLPPIYETKELQDAEIIVKKIYSDHTYIFALGLYGYYFEN